MVPFTEMRQQGQQVIPCLACPFLLSPLFCTECIHGRHASTLQRGPSLSLSTQHRKETLLQSSSVSCHSSSSWSLSDLFVAESYGREPIPCILVRSPFPGWCIIANNWIVLGFMLAHGVTNVDLHHVITGASRTLETTMTLMPTLIMLKNKDSLILLR